MYINTAASDGFLLLGMIGLFAAVVLTGLMSKFRKVYEYRFSRKSSKTVSKIVMWGVVYFIACAIFMVVAGNNAETGLDRITNWSMFDFLIVYPICIHQHRDLQRQGWWRLGILWRRRRLFRRWILWRRFRRRRRRLLVDPAAPARQH